MLTINEKNKIFASRKAKEFRKVLNECFYDQTWCDMHRINYVRLLDKDVLHAKEVLYNEMFENLKD